LQKNALIAKVVAAALPPLAKLDKLSFDAILGKYKGVIVLPAKGFGIDLNDAAVEEIVEKLVGVKEWPAFRRERYTVLC
jgi:hypothetical protein